MPSNTVRPGEEREWERAKAQAEKAGHKKDWSYVTSIFLKMVGRDKEAAMVKRIAERALRAYEESGLTPEGWQHGHVTDQPPYKPEGSDVPPPRDRNGQILPMPELPPMDIPGYGTMKRMKAPPQVP